MGARLRITEGYVEAEADRLHAVIVPNFDVLRQRKIVNAKEAIRFDIEGLSPEIASTKRIGSYEIWQEALPRTTTRKIKRFEVEHRVKEEQAAAQVEGGLFERQRFRVVMDEAAGQALASIAACRSSPKST